MSLRKNILLPIHNRVRIYIDDEMFRNPSKFIPLLLLIIFTALFFGTIIMVILFYRGYYMYNIYIIIIWNLFLLVG